MAQAARMGAEIRLARTTLAMSREELARRAGLAASTVKRIERGDPGMQVDTLCAVGTAAGIDIVLRAYPGRAISLRDSGQLRIAEHLVDLAGSYRQARMEVPAGEHGRSADLVLLGVDEIIHVEIERMATDFQAQYRSAVAKRDALAAVHARPVRLVLAVEDTARNRAALLPHLRLITGQLPAGSRQILAALRGGHALGTDGLLWVRAPRSRSIGRDST